MVNLIPPDHVDDVPVVELNQYDDVLVVPKLVLVNEDKDLEEDEFKDEEDPQEEEDDMEVDIKEDENEPELTYNYEEMNPINPSPPASESEPEDAIEVENLIEHEDETILASIHEVGESSTTPFLHEDNDGLLHGLMRRDINSLFGLMASSWSRRKERQRMGFIIMPPKSAPMTQARQMIKENVDNERARHANVGNDDRGSGPVRGQDAAPAARECTFDGFMKCDPTASCVTEGALMMCPRMVEPERVKVDAYIQGLNDIIKGEVTSSKPANLSEAVRMALIAHY
nr:hypothetical protein [Tanacetum cinerariifolium]